jgi:hypothetical protein
MLRTAHDLLDDLLLRPLRKRRHHGAARQCVVCGSGLRSFLPFGDPPRPEAMCPVCGALERHRMIWLYLERRTDLLDGRPKGMLHFAPERPIRRRLRHIPHLDYVTADLDSQLADLAMDITDIQFPDDAFDVIYCSHVLEHVPDDQRAMRELRRVLAPCGWAILQVPIRGLRTEEDPQVKSPEERRRLYGQADHVRQYGADYRDRLIDAGFAVEREDFVGSLSEAERSRWGLPPGDDVFFCRKRLS